MLAARVGSDAVRLMSGDTQNRPRIVDDDSADAVHPARRPQTVGDASAEEPRRIWSGAVRRDLVAVASEFANV